MNKKLCIIGIVIYCMGCFTISAQKPEDILNNFFTYYKAGDTQKAYEEFFHLNREMDEQDFSSFRPANDLENIREQMGDFYGYEVLGQRYKEKSYRILFILVKQERGPLLFIFHLYKPEDDWFGYHFEYSKEFGKLEEKVIIVIDM